MAELLLDKEAFKKFFIKLLEDEDFRLEIIHDGFGALERQGFDVSTIDPEVRASLSRAMAKATDLNAKGGYKCELCGVCGTCGLCGGIDLGSFSAALWATFALGLTTASRSE